MRRIRRGSPPGSERSRQTPHADLTRREVGQLALASAPALAALAAHPAAALAAPAAQGATVGQAIVSAASEETSGGDSIVVRVHVDTRGASVPSGGARIEIPIPTGVRVSESWAGVPGQHGAQVSGQTATWFGATPGVNGWIGPFAVRLVPNVPAEGPRVFRGVTLTPRVVWRGASGDVTAQVQPIRLTGLWSEINFRRTVMPNALTILTVERPESPTISLRVAVRAGSRDENDVTSGGSHWLEHAFFLGTERFPNAQVLSEMISAVGGQENASTAWEFTDYYKLVPAEEFPLALDLLSDQLVNSTFRKEEFDRERVVVFEELKLRNDTPAVRAFDEFINVVFQVSPLRRHPAGTIDSVQNIPIETILAHKTAHYTTANTAIAASGNLRHDDAVERIAQAFARYPVGPRHQRPRTPEPPQTVQRRIEVGNGTRLAEICLGWPAPGAIDAEFPALYFVQEILGETGRRLSEEIRDRRALASGVDVGLLDFSDAGGLLLSATTRPDRAEEVVRLLIHEVQRLRDGDLTDDDVKTSLRAIRGRRALAEEFNQSQTGRSRPEVADTFDLFSYEEALDILGQVTAADVRRVAQRWLDPVNYTLVIVRA